MLYLSITPLVLLFIVTLIDEFYFHMKRGLPFWERVSHPFDTTIVFISFSIPLFYPLEKVSLISFVVLGVLSLICVTKEEFLHDKVCSTNEKWLHAIFYGLHPLAFVSIGFLWWAKTANNPTISASFSIFSHYIILISSVGLLLFITYQIIYWNLIYSDTKNIYKPRINASLQAKNN